MEATKRIISLFQFVIDTFCHIKKSALKSVLFFSYKSFFKFSILIFCSFFHLLYTTEVAEKNISTIITSAQDLFEANLYDDAIIQYQEALNRIENNDSLEPLSDEIGAKIRQRLSHAFFHIGDYNKSIYYLKKIDRNCADEYLYAIALRNNDLRQEAIDILKNLYEKEDNTASKKDEIFLELGLTYFLNNELDKAQEIFSKLAAKDTPLKNKVLLYQAKIASKNSQTNAALKHLQSIDENSCSTFFLSEFYFTKGEIFYHAKNYKQAIDAFEKNFSDSQKEASDLHKNTLYYLGSSYSKLAINENNIEHFNKSIYYLEKLCKQYREDRSFNALLECYLSKGYHFQDEESFDKVKSLIEDKSLFSHEYIKETLPLLEASSFKTFNQRDLHFRHITADSMMKESFYPLAWHFRGVNEYCQAALLKKQQSSDYQKLYDRAIASLSKGLEFLNNDLETQAKTYLLLAKIENESKRKSLSLKNLKVLMDDPKLLNALDDPLEAFVMCASIENNNDETKAHLSDAISKYPNSSLRNEALKLLGTLHYLDKNYEKAYQSYDQISKDSIEHTPTAYLWMCYCLDKRDPVPKEAIFSLKQQIINQYPSSKEAEIADFNLYNYQDYLQNDKTAIKHLNAFLQKYPNSPFSINAHFLLGLDYKRDRKKSDSKKVVPKNLNKSIDHFQMAENTFNHLYSQGLIKDDQIEHYLLVNYRSQLEKALANFTLAEESAGAKKNIYLEFSKDFLKKLYDELNLKENAYKKNLSGSDAFWHLKEETVILLSQSYLAMNQTDESEKILKNQLENYEKLKISRGYFLSRTYSQLAKIYYEKKNYLDALNAYFKAEESAIGKLLSREQQLQLWIDESNCLKELKNYDQAILILSKAVNDDAASSLRIKAMFLRALINEKQQRFELAKKQLIATSKLSGEYAIKAKEKLEKDYGYK